MSCMIETRALTKYYPRTDSPRDVILNRVNDEPAVDRVSIHVQKGEIFGLLGPNGAGKTTLVKILCTLISPTSGEAWIDGTALQDGQHLKAFLGLVTSDERSFYWRLSGEENLRFFAALHGIPGEDISGRVADVLEIVDLEEKGGDPFRTYSTGMRQRLSIARALLHYPRVLFLDEPTKGLDPTAARKLHRLIRDQLTEREGMTVFLTTHQLEEAERLCDRLAIMKNGKILEVGTPGELKSRWDVPDLREVYEQVTHSAENLSPLIEDLPLLPRQSPQRRGIAPGEALPTFGIPIQKALAFIRRDFLLEWSYSFSFFLQFFHVFFSAAVFYFIARMIGSADLPQLAPYGGDYFSFVLIGIALSGYFGVGLSSFSQEIRKAQTTGTLEAMLTTPTRLSTVVISSSLWNYLLTTLRVLVYILLGVAVLGVNITPRGWGPAVVILILTVFSMSSLGIIAASFIMVIKKGDPVTWVLNALTNLLGGIYYPVEILPVWLRFFSAFLPVTYALRGMRGALLVGASFMDIQEDLLVLTAFSVILLPLSLAGFRLAVRRAKQDGSLSHY